MLASVGVVMVYSATRIRLTASGADPTLLLKRQILWVVLGVIAGVAAMAVDYRRLSAWAPAAYAGILLALGAVLSPLGSSAKGSQRWFNIGPFQLQPAAFASLIFVVCLASLTSRSGGSLSTKVTAVAVLTGLPLIVLVAIQPDLGSAIVLGIVLITVLAVAGARPRDLLILGVLALIAGVAAVQLGVLKHYQVARLTAFLDQGHDVRQSSYNLQQSKIAIGSGGLLGKGLFHGSQTNLSYVPEQQTDFIFTAVGEQLGLIGSAIVLGVYATVVWRVWASARLARDLFGTLLSIGVFAILAIQIFENMGMTMGIMPVTGIPLPLLSYGGSSTVVMLVGIGLALNVRMRRFS